ncbi:MAG: GNAT family N-acetyltransferase, partial [Peptostreptococcaceae bacterium]
MKENTYPQMKILETKNCILRPASIEDAKDMFEYYSVPEVVKYLPIKKHNSLSDTTKFIKLFFLQNYNKGKIGHYAIVYKSDNKVIGNVGFNNILPSSRSGEIGICINPNYWGKKLSMELCLKILEFGFVDL